MHRSIAAKCPQCGFIVVPFKINDVYWADKYTHCLHCGKRNILGMNCSGYLWFSWINNWAIVGVSRKHFWNQWQENLPVEYKREISTDPDALRSAPEQKQAEIR